MNRRPTHCSPIPGEIPADDSLPTRHSLLNRLRDLGDSQSWQTFFDRYWRLIYHVARKTGLSDDAAQEVVQETVIAVARKMPDFCYDPAKGSFRHWLLLITRRRIQDHWRRIYRSLPSAELPEMARTDQAEGLPCAEPSPDAQLEAVWEAEWRETLVHGALSRLRQQVNPKHYQVFDYCVLQGQPAPEVARMLGLNVAQVHLAKYRMRHRLKRMVRDLEIELNGVASRGP